MQGIAALEPRETSDRRGKFPNVRLARRKLHARIRVHATAQAVRTSGQVAQLVEQRTENPRAEGSSPPLTTTCSGRHQAAVVFPWALPRFT